MFKDIKLTLMSPEEENSEIFQKYDKKAAITDFAILLGGDIPDQTPYMLKGAESLKDRTGGYSTDEIEFDQATEINKAGDEEKKGINKSRHSIRPILVSPVIYEFALKNSKDATYGIKEFEFGEYPQWAVDKETSKDLDTIFSGSEYCTKSLEETGKTYTVDEGEIADNPFIPNTMKEYEYKGKKYLRVTPHPGVLTSGRFVLMSNGTTIDIFNHVWIEVSPIKWLIDEKNRVLVSKNVLSSGLRIADKHFEGDFEKTEMYRYLNDYMLKDIIQHIKFDEIKMI